MLNEFDIAFEMDELSFKRSKFSPLYTSKKDEEYKMKFIKQHGRDKDGAFRVTRRLDSKDKAK